MSRFSVPTFDKMLLPTIEALEALGGSGTIDEIYNKPVQILDLPEEVLDIPQGNTSHGAVEYAPTHLVKGSLFWRTIAFKEILRLNLCRAQQRLRSNPLG
jgi:hypothetical protein